MDLVEKARILQLKVKSSKVMEDVRCAFQKEVYALLDGNKAFIKGTREEVETYFNILKKVGCAENLKMMRIR